ncbi:uncharacterized protein B0I36DRAFT_376913 [Microdochium trichocladiopsis]|uniref:Uncharacterized protein n=1 Tax=Microdochium trichocladiopsis TaxID=1682393 RepID=A0A9P8XWL5_9PEZI|nr:uncharacterized protein B0I36DRAFT_376913 [Microdochium trichocladiopsis]KAH7020717.1 hypothetical protein B0I36DRAFT_376913 [Microdochium trichocladiopsis]
MASPTAAALPMLTALVTGGAWGLGRAIAEAFLSAGHNVAVCDVNAERLEDFARDLAAAHEGRFLAEKTDITDEAAVEALVGAITSRFGRLDFVVNNAGIIDTFDPVGTTTKAQWDRVLGVNLTGTFIVTKVAVNAMLEQSPSGGTVHGVVGITRNTAGVYGAKSIYSVVLLLGGMDDTNLSDSFRTAGINTEGIQLIGQVNPGYTPGKTNVALADVAKYCLFLSDPAIAATSNGGTITFHKNWPCA